MLGAKKGSEPPSSGATLREASLLPAPATVAGSKKSGLAPILKRALRAIAFDLKAATIRHPEQPALSEKV